MNNIFSSPNKIIEIVISLGLAPIVFYFAGMFNLSAYYATLGINTCFLDFSYQYYIFIGFLNSIIFLLFFPSFFDDYYKAKMEVQNKSSDNISSLDKFNDEYIATTSKIFPKNRREKMVKKMYELLLFLKSAKFKKIFNVIYFGVILFFVTFFYLKGNFIFTIISLQVFIVFLVSFFAFTQIKNIFIEKKKVVNPFSKSLVLLLVLFFLLPGCFGVVQAFIQLKQNNFEKVKVYTKNEVIDVAGFMGAGKNFYFFRTDKGNLFVPQNEIIKMEHIVEGR